MPTNGQRDRFIPRGRGLPPCVVLDGQWMPRRIILPPGRTHRSLPATSKNTTSEEGRGRIGVVSRLLYNSRCAKNKTLCFVRKARLVIARGRGPPQWWRPARRRPLRLPLPPRRSSLSPSRRGSLGAPFASSCPPRTRRLPPLGSGSGSG